MRHKWYQSRLIQASIISGLFLLFVTILPNLLHRSSKEHIIYQSESLEIKPPYSLEIKSDISLETIDSVLVAMRKSRKLRSLTPMESGKSIAKSPYRTFFFLFHRYLVFSESDIEKVWERSVVNRMRWSPYSYFEIHYVSEKQVFVVVFLSSETESSISKLDGTSRKEITLSPFPWDDFDALVFMPLDRIIKVETREIYNNDKQSICLLDIIVQ